MFLSPLTSQMKLFLTSAASNPQANSPCSLPIEPANGFNLPRQVGASSIGNARVFGRTRGCPIFGFHRLRRHFVHGFCIVSLPSSLYAMGELLQFRQSFVRVCHHLFDGRTVPFRSALILDVWHFVSMKKISLLSSLTLHSSLILRYYN